MRCAFTQPAMPAAYAIRITRRPLSGLLDYSSTAGLRSQRNGGENIIIINAHSRARRYRACTMEDSSPDLLGDPARPRRPAGPGARRKSSWRRSATPPTARSPDATIVLGTASLVARLPRRAPSCGRSYAFPRRVGHVDTAR